MLCAALVQTPKSLSGNNLAAFQGPYQQPSQPPVQQADVDWQEFETAPAQTRYQSPAQQADNNGQGPTQRLPYRQP